MLKASKRFISVFVVVVMVLSLAVTASATNGNFSPNPMIQGWEGQTLNSTSGFRSYSRTGTINTLTITPSNGSTSGLILPTQLHLRNANTGVTQTVTWNGSTNSITFSNFRGQPITGNYEIWWTGRVVGNTPGNPLWNQPETTAIRSFVFRIDIT